MSPRRFNRRTYMILASGRSALTLKAAMSASSAPTTIRSAFPFAITPTVNCQDIFERFHKADQVEALAEKMARSQLASKAPHTTRMNVMVLRALVASALAFLLLAGSVILFSETGTAPALLQLLD